MATDPVSTYLESKKTAGFGDAARSFMQGAGSLMSNAAQGSASPVAHMLGEHAGHTALAVGSAAVAYGGAKLLQGAYDAATKSHDFKSMLDANPDLGEMHAENPKLFNQMFSTLRTFNPSFTRDPIVAGHYMRSMVGDPMHAGSMAVEALTHRDRMHDPLQDRVTGAAFGAGKHR
jgi:hypothetical protein